MKIVRKVLNLCQHLLDRCAGNDLLDPELLFFLLVGIHVNLRNSAEEVVCVAHDVLVRSHEKEPQERGIIRLEGVHWEKGLVSAGRYIVTYPPIRVACEVD